jgi:hypothetical protein
MGKTWRRVAAGAVAACVLAVAGCSAGTGGVASLGGDAGGETAGRAQRQAAEAMVDCLASSSVPARLKELDDAENQADVWPADEGGPWQLCDEEGCNLGGTDGLSEAALAATIAQFEDMAAGRPAGESRKWLFVDGQDLTAEWAACEAETGYAKPAYVEDPQDEELEKRRTAEASAAWASCARGHGFPATKDPAAPKADGWATAPRAVLPATITEAELRALLADCPTFDREARLKADRAAAEDPNLGDDEYWRIAGTEAVIGFDVPCWNGSEAVCDDATWAKYNPLVQVIEEQTNEYLREWNQAEGHG